MLYIIFIIIATYYLCYYVIFCLSFTVPSGPPADVTVDVITSQEIELSWNEPACGTRHGHVVHYQYRLLDTRSDRAHTAITTDTKIQFGNLVPFTEYRFRLRASSILGYGPYSEDLSIQTLAARELDSFIYHVYWIVLFV